ncbi:MAG: DNA-binding domain-containing protein [Gammaproteobacteria bacterium]
MLKQTDVMKMPSFMQTQIQFAQHIRDPQQLAKPVDVEDRRMAIYRDLLYNNIENFLSSGFPVIRSIYTDEHWHYLVRDFFNRHRCETPYFLEISQEFIDYLQNEREPQTEDPAGLIELAHYEWLELALSIADDEIDSDLINPNGDLLKAHPIVSPLAWTLTYQFPVHKISKDYLPSKAPEQATHLVIYRNRIDEIHFMEINAVTAHLLKQLNDHPSASGFEILQDIARQLKATEPEIIIRAGLSSMQELQVRGVILGTRQV